MSTPCKHPHRGGGRLSATIESPTLREVPLEQTTHGVSTRRCPSSHPLRPRPLLSVQLPTHDRPHSIMCRSRLRRLASWQLQRRSPPIFAGQTTRRKAVEKEAGLPRNWNMESCTCYSAMLYWLAMQASSCILAADAAGAPQCGIGLPQLRTPHRLRRKAGWLGAQSAWTRMRCVP